MVVDLGFTLILCQNSSFAPRFPPPSSVKGGPLQQVWYLIPQNRYLAHEHSIKAVSTTSEAAATQGHSQQIFTSEEP